MVYSLWISILPGCSIYPKLHIQKSRHKRLGIDTWYKCIYINFDADHYTCKCSRHFKFSQHLESWPRSKFYMVLNLSKILLSNWAICQWNACWIFEFKLKPSEIRLFRKHCFSLHRIGMFYNHCHFCHCGYWCLGFTSSIWRYVYAVVVVMYKSLDIWSLFFLFDFIDGYARVEGEIAVPNFQHLKNFFLVEYLGPYRLFDL